MICVIKNSKVFAIHTDEQVAEIRNKYSGLDIIHVADDANVTLGGTDPRDLGATWKDARFLLNSLELDSPFRIKSAFYTSGTDTLSIVIASGTGETFSGNTINTITKTSDTTFTINPVSASITYTIYLKNDGNFASSIDGTITDGSLLIGTISTNADKTVNIIVDKRPLVSGVGKKFANHLADGATISKLGHVYHATLTTTLDTTWTGTEAPYTKTQTVTGISSNDNPIVDVVMSGTFTTDEERANEWGKIYRVTTANNSITLYAMDKPEVSLPIQLKVVR